LCALRVPLRLSPKRGALPTQEGHRRRECGRPSRPARLRRESFLADAVEWRSCALGCPGSAAEDPGTRRATAVTHHLTPALTPAGLCLGGYDW
jgi:hypothetical protein